MEGTNHLGKGQCNVKFKKQRIHMTQRQLYAAPEDVLPWLWLPLLSYQGSLCATFTSSLIAAKGPRCQQVREKLERCRAGKLLDRHTNTRGSFIWGSELVSSFYFSLCWLFLLESLSGLFFYPTGFSIYFFPDVILLFFPDGTFLFVSWCFSLL